MFDQWDLGWQGVGLLALMALGFGVIVQVALWRSTPKWLWLAGSLTYFVSGLFISEVWFGWATEADLQPNIDGLSFDEVLLIGLIPGLLVAGVVWWAGRQRRIHEPMHT